MRLNPTLLLSTILAIGLSCAAAGESSPATPAEANPRVVITTSKGEITCELFRAECPKTVANFIELAEGRREFTTAEGAKQTRPFYDGLIFHRVIAGFMIQGGDPQGTGAGGPGYAFEDEFNPVNLGLDAKAFDGNAFHPWVNPQDQKKFERNFIQPRFSALPPGTSSDARKQLVDQLLDQMAKMSLIEFNQHLGYRYDAKLAPAHPPVRGSLAMANSGPNTNGSQFFINLGDTPHLRGKHTVFGQVVAGMEVVDAIGAVATGGANRPIEPVVIRSIRLAVPAAPATPKSAP